MGFFSCWVLLFSNLVWKFENYSKLFFPIKVTLKINSEYNSLQDVARNKSFLLGIWSSYFLKIKRERSRVYWIFFFFLRKLTMRQSLKILTNYYQSENRTWKQLLVQAASLLQLKKTHHFFFPSEWSPLNIPPRNHNELMWSEFNSKTHSSKIHLKKAL